MQFLKTLFWIALTVVLVLLARNNWSLVTLRLWGGLEVDTYLPLLLLFAFLIGFLPVFILYRARLWSLRRRLDAQGQQASATYATAPSAPTAPVAADDRIATDTKVWPAA